MTAPMGQSQNIAANRPAWRAVNADGVRRPAVGMSRDFPTASEVAQGMWTLKQDLQAGDLRYREESGRIECTGPSSTGRGTVAGTQCLHAS